jgi:hypothetical protein
MLLALRCDSRLRGFHVCKLQHGRQREAEYVLAEVELVRNASPAVPSKRLDDLRAAHS